MADSRESEICVPCGICCDGTLFDRAVTGEPPEHLVRIGFRPLAAGAGLGAGFALPCTHFAGKCTIYASERPGICGAFRCELLRAVERGEYTVEGAQAIVAETKAQRAAVLPEMGAMMAEASPADQARALMVQAGILLPAMVDPAMAAFREKHGRALGRTLLLVSRLRKYFVPYVSHTMGE